jgi:hypothetical protein
MRLFSVVPIGLTVALLSCKGPDAQPDLREWTIGTAPTLTIGGESTQTEFSRVNGAWRLSNGAIAVADAGLSEIRIFDARGAFAYAFGRSGAGPGEFRGMGWIGRFGDTAAVYDGNLRRITTLLLDGAPLLLTTLPVTVSDERGVDVAGRLADGRWLVRAASRPDVNVRGVQRIPGFAGLIGADAAGSVQWLAEEPDLAVFVYNPAGNPKLVSIVIPAFPSSFAMAASGSSIWFGDTAADTIVHVDAATGVRKTVKLPDPPAPVPRALVDAARTRELATARDQAARELVEAKYSSTFLPAHLPAFQALVPGAAGELWVQRPAVSRVAEARYVVLSASGSPVARVSVAVGFRVTDVGRDYVVGVHQDGDGVETVRVYALTR